MYSHLLASTPVRSQVVFKRVLVGISTRGAGLPCHILGVVTPDWYVGNVASELNYNSMPARFGSAVLTFWSILKVAM